jgi:hypothetical protein
MGDVIMAQEQQQQDIRLVHAEALALMQKAMTVATDTFNSVYNQAVKLQQELETTKAALAAQQKVEPEQK